MQTALAGHRPGRALATAAHAQTVTAVHVVRARCRAAGHRRRARTRTPGSEVVGVGTVGYRCDKSCDVPEVDRPVREHAVRLKLADRFDRSGRVAASVGLSSDEAIAAANAPALRAELTTLIQSNYDERDIFGVPMFITPSGEQFWGHDRMEWALRYGKVRASG